MRRFVARVRALFQRSRLQRELDDEVAAHLEMATAEHRRRGLPAGEARLAALREFGGVARAKERHAEVRGLPLIETVAADARYACRGLRRTPGFTLVALATLTLAIGANTAIFSVVNAALMRPLAYRDADRLAIVGATRDIPGAVKPVRATFPLDAAVRWQQAVDVFDSVAFYAGTSFQLSRADGTEVVNGATVSSSFFSTVSGTIVAGRPFAPADPPAPVVVISQRLADRLFGRPAAAVGAHLTLNAHVYTVIGVAGPQWDVPRLQTDVWENVAFKRTINPRCCDVGLLGRLKKGVTWAQARADVRDTAAGLAKADPLHFRSLHTSVTSLRDEQLGASRPALFLLWATVAVVLVVACANLLNLLIARNLARTREVTIRQALGASRGRLIVQGLTESALLAAGGLAGGLVVAYAATTMLARISPDMFPQLDTARIDTTVLAFALGIAVLTTFAAGLLPSMQAARTTTLRTTTNAPSRWQRRAQQALCAGQLGAAVLLIGCATLLGRSLAGLMATDLGVSSDHVLTASVNVGLGRPHTAQEIASTMQRIVERVRQIPGVLAAGAGTSRPPNASYIMMSLTRTADQISYTASAVSCTPEYFHALGMRLIRGRFFTDADDAQHPLVIVIGATTARHLFGDVDPIGQTFNVPKFPYMLSTAKEATVVGVVSDVKYSGIDTAAGDQIYWPLAQVPWVSDYLAVRTSGAGDLAAPLQRAVASVDPTVAISAIRPLDSILAAATAPARFRTSLIVAFALLALAIAAVGLYGTVAYSVSQRTAEIGVRMALGAASGEVLSLVLGEAVVIAAGGLAIGMPAAYATSQAFRTMLFGVAPTDWLTYALSSVLLVLVSLGAAYAPARRAARVDPIVALRIE